MLKCKSDKKAVVMWTWLNHGNPIFDKDNTSFGYIRQVKRQSPNPTTHASRHLFLSSQYYCHSIPHITKTVPTFLALLAFLLVKPVSLYPRPLSFSSPLTRLCSSPIHVCDSLSCSCYVLHFSPAYKYEKRPYHFISNPESFTMCTSDNGWCNNAFIRNYIYAFQLPVIAITFTMK